VTNQLFACSAGDILGTPDRAAALMKPCAGAIEAWEVGAAVGNVKNNGPELAERIGLFNPKS
jgi:putative SOS response-associated peptidase YedK